jgi:hypothetical protein
MKVQMALRTGIACMVIMGFVACKGKSSKTPETTVADTAKTAPVTPAAPATAAVTLLCKDTGTDSLGTPHYDVYLSADGKETKIKSINGCAEIVKADYASHEIPADALAACGGWWAGAGDYYYVIMKDGKPVVYEGWQDEGQKDKGYHWKEFKMK